MNLTYEEILRKLKTTFFNESGHNVNLMSDIGIRFQAVASELYAISCYGDFILNQSFPKTASGNYLDLHGEMRGIKRKNETKALGSLTFSMDEPKESIVTVPENCVCSVSEYPFIQFKTMESGVILAGDTSVTIPAEALNCGEEYNREKGTVTVMLNPPTSISNVTNDDDFIGGYSLESDDSFRNRIINSYQIPLNGINKNSIAQVILNFDYVIDCCVSNTENSNVIDVFVNTKTGKLTAQQKQELKNSIGIAELTEKEFNVSITSPQNVNLNIEIETDTFNDEIENYVRYCAEYFFTGKIAESIRVSEIIAKILQNEHIKDCAIFCNSYKLSTIVPKNGCYLKLVKTEVLADV